MPDKVRKKSTVRAAMIWMVFQSITSKIVRLFGQVVLAWYLLPEHFGLFAMTLAVRVFAELLADPGLKTVVIQRPVSSRLFVHSQALSCLMGLFTAAVLFIVAPLIAEIYASPDLAGLIYVVAIALPLRAIRMPFEALLMKQMRFKIVAILDSSEIIVGTLLSIWLAQHGWGAYSMVIPLTVTQGIRCIVEFTIVRNDLAFGRVRKKYFIALVFHTSQIFFARAMTNVTLFGDYIVLGLFHPVSVVGIYYMGYSLSVQAIQLMSSNFSKVLLPAMSATQDKQEQITRYVNAINILSIVVIPVCFLQVNLAYPFVRILLGDQYLPVAPVIQILSIGTAIRAVGTTASALMNAQGRYRMVFYATSVYAVAILVFATAGALVGKEQSMAFSVASYLVLMGPTHVYLAIRPSRHALRQVVSVFVPPLLVSALSCAGSMCFSEMVKHNTPLSDLVTYSLVTVCSFTTIYLVLSFAIYPVRMRQLFAVFGLKVSHA